MAGISSGYINVWSKRDQKTVTTRLASANLWLNFAGRNCWFPINQLPSLLFCPLVSNDWNSAQNKGSEKAVFYRTRAGLKPRVRVPGVQVRVPGVRVRVRDRQPSVIWLDELGTNIWLWECVGVHLKWTEMWVCRAPPAACRPGRGVKLLQRKYFKMIQLCCNIAQIIP